MCLCIVLATERRNWPIVACARSYSVACLTIKINKCHFYSAKMKDPVVTCVVELETFDRQDISTILLSN